MQGALFVCGNEGCAAGKGIFGKLRYERDGKVEMPNKTVVYFGCI